MEKLNRYIESLLYASKSRVLMYAKWLSKQWRLKDGLIMSLNQSGSILSAEFNYDVSLGFNYVRKTSFAAFHEDAAFASSMASKLLFSILSSV